MDGAPPRKMRRIVDEDDDEDLPDITDPRFLNIVKATTPQPAEVKEDEDSDAGLFSGDDDEDVNKTNQSPSKEG